MKAPRHNQKALARLRPIVANNRRPLSFSQLRELLPHHGEMITELAERVRPDTTEFKSLETAKRKASEHARLMMSRVVLFDDPAAALEALHGSIPRSGGWKNDFDFGNSLEVQINRHLARNNHRTPRNFIEEFEAPVEPEMRRGTRKMGRYSSEAEEEDRFGR